MRPVIALVALSACEAEPNVVSETADSEAVLLVGPTMTLTSTPWVGSFNAVVMVTGAPANQRLQLAASPNLGGAGLCPPQTAPLCVDLALPIQLLGSRRANASGTAVFTVPVPDPVGVVALELQVALLAGANSEKSNALVVPLHDLGTDLDNDDLTAEDELTIWGTDPADRNTDNDGFFDGTEATAGTDALDAGDFPPTYDDDLYPDIFLVECAGCHVLGSTDGGLNLDRYNQIVNRPSNDVPTMDRIEPFDMNNSYMWHKLSGTQLLVGGAGLRMPRNGPPFLTVDQMALVEDWINTGALEGPDQ